MEQTIFVSLCRRSLPPGIGITVWHSSTPVTLNMWLWPDKNFLRCKKRWTIIANVDTMLFVGVSCFGTQLAYNFLNSRCAVTVLCNKEWEIYRKWLLAQLPKNFETSLCSVHSKTYQRPHLSVGGSLNKSLHLQTLRRCYSENSGSPVSACVMRRHCSITYTQSLHAVNGLLAVGRAGNLLCGMNEWNCFWEREGLIPEPSHSRLM